MISTRTAALLQNARGCNTFTNALHTSSVLNARVAVVLSGCGVFDGSEIHEASAVLVHLSRNEAEVEIFAPDIRQAHVVNHMNGHPMEKERRFVLVESARIARKKLPALDTLKTVDFDGVIFPGGFGVAKNLSTFALDGVAMTINPDVERVLKEFHEARKPIGMCCIAPVLVAKLFRGCEVTVGSDKEEGGRWPYFETAESIFSMNSTHVKKNVTECHIDHANKIVTTPAFMCETAIHHIFDGIGLMVKGVLSFIPQKITCK